MSFGAAFCYHYISPYTVFSCVLFSWLLLGEVGVPFTAWLSVFLGGAGWKATYIKNLSNDLVGYIIKANFLSYTHLPDFFTLFTVAFLRVCLQRVRLPARIFMGPPLLGCFGLQLHACGCEGTICISPV